MENERRAAVSFVVRGNSILAVWNKRYSGWTMPGGKVEEGETPAQAQRRELREETGLETRSAEEIYVAETTHSIHADRGRLVHVFSVIPEPGEPKTAEFGCPVCWLSIEKFLELSPFADFYRRMFASLKVKW